MIKRLLSLITLMIAMKIFAINVGGHLTQDTIWYPDNNPYVVTSFLYVDSGVTLTILPGVHVEISSADMNNYLNFKWIGATPPIAKSIVVYGQIIAIGNSTNPISFTTNGEESNLKWGVIKIFEQAEECSFEYCTFQDSFSCGWSNGDWTMGVLTFLNGSIRIRNCSFIDNFGAIGGFDTTTDITIYGCRFIINDNDYPPPFASVSLIGIWGVTDPVPEDYYKVTIAKCYFSGLADMYYIRGYTKILFLNNTFDDFYDVNPVNAKLYLFGCISFYGNTVVGESNVELICTSGLEEDPSYCRRNYMNTTYNNSIAGSGGTADFPIYYISDNILHGTSYLYLDWVTTAVNYCYNNYVESYSMTMIRNEYPNFGGEVHFFNNVSEKVSGFLGMIYLDRAYPTVYNNVGVNYNAIFGGGYTGIWSNNIVTGLTENPSAYSDSLYPAYFASNCFSLPFLIAPFMIDLGGNIVADPVFADTLNHDYHLAAGSPCIDTGAPFPDSLGVAGLPPFDADYNVRTVGSSTDMGAYEYGSVYIGGISGNVYDNVTNQIVDCAKIEIVGKLPEFSDTLGCYVYPTGSGTYTVKVSRWDYHDLIIPNVQVNLGEVTMLQIPLAPDTVGNEDDNQLPVVNAISLCNYPNPFCASTKLSFILSESGKTDLIIYNAKGQKVRTLLSSLLKKGFNTAEWDGRDDEGRLVGSGLYFGKVTYGGRSTSHKLLLIK